MRYKLTIEYDGSNFCGWQRQKDALSVQQAVEEALFLLTGQSLSLIAAGRTDAGVHALGQVVHMDLNKEWPLYKLRDGLNFYLRQAGHLISIVKAQAVAPNFHARFDAYERHYLYRICNRPSPPSLDAKRVWWLANELNIKAMQRAARYLIGQHDFTTFRAKMCQAKSPIKHLYRLDISKEGDMVNIYASAPSFLHHQIRSIAGSLRAVGSGFWREEDLHKALLARDRTRCAMVAPAHGLYFLGADYRDEN